jgi:hypothetical protein
VAAAAAAGFVLFAAPALAAASPGKRPRPSEVPVASVESSFAPNAFQMFNDYATLERVFSSQRAVVHYVVRGINAPPLNDDDGDGVPDYVERVGEAADTAIGYYERRGFHAILPDWGGPNPRPDLYVSRFTAGWFGVALPGARAEGGAFVAIANNLDQSPERSLGSLYGTVAHELFHLVQFSYFSPNLIPPTPTWVTEGTAAAMETLVYPDSDDIVLSLQLRNWLAAPERSITIQSYGSQLLWRYLDRLDAHLLPAYFSRLTLPFAGEGAGALVDTFRSVTHTSFAAAFQRFAVGVADDHADELRPFRTLRVPGRYRSAIAPLAIHYIRLSLPRHGHHAVTVSFANGPDGGKATLVYQVESAIAGNPSRLVRIDPKQTAAGRRLTFAIPTRLQRGEGFTAPLLVVSNGSANHAARYRIDTTP